MLSRHAFIFSLHIQQQLVEHAHYLVFAHSSLNDDKDGIVAGDGPQDFWDVAVVQVVCDTAGIAWTSFDDADIPREIDGQKPRRTHHLSCRNGLVHPAVHGFVG